MSVPGFRLEKPKQYTIDASEFHRALMEAAAEEKSITIRPAAYAPITTGWREYVGEVRKASSEKPDIFGLRQPMWEPEKHPREDDTQLYDVGGYYPVPKEIEALQVTLGDLQRKLKDLGEVL